MFSEFITQHCQRINIASSSNQAQYNTPNDQGRFESMPEAKQCQSEISEYASFRDKRQRSHGLLHCDLRDGGQIEMSVMRHNNTVE